MDCIRVVWEELFCVDLGLTQTLLDPSKNANQPPPQNGLKKKKKNSVQSLGWQVAKGSWFRESSIHYSLITESKNEQICFTIFCNLGIKKMPLEFFTHSGKHTFLMYNIIIIIQGVLVRSI